MFIYLNESKAIFGVKNYNELKKFLLNDCLLIFLLKVIKIFKYHIT